MIILFDLDGTLIDSTEAILESFYHALAYYGELEGVQPHQITSQIGHPLEVMFAGVGIRECNVDAHVATYKAHYRTIACQKTVMLPDAIRAVEEASTFARLGIVTTKTGRYSRELMEYFGIMHHFEVLVGFEDVEHRKPHPQPILKALEQMGSSNENVWMIGDTCLDLEAAWRAGVEAIGVLSGYDTQEQLATFHYPIEKNVLDAVRLLGKKGIK
jgi:phosphoglycolate phosphatase